MALFELKCSSCGGSIQMDDTKETGFCMYCGNKFIVKDEIQKILIQYSGSVEINKSNELENILILARRKFDEGYGQNYKDEKEFNKFVDSIKKEYLEKAYLIDANSKKARELERYIRERTTEKEKSITSDGKRGCMGCLAFFFVIFLLFMIFRFVSEISRYVIR